MLSWWYGKRRILNDAVKNHRIISAHGGLSCQAFVPLHTLRSSFCIQRISARRLATCTQKISVGYRFAWTKLETLMLCVHLDIRLIVIMELFASLCHRTRSSRMQAIQHLNRDIGLFNINSTHILIIDVSDMETENVDRLHKVAGYIIESSEKVGHASSVTGSRSFACLPWSLMRSSPTMTLVETS